MYDIHVSKHPALPALRSQSWGSHHDAQQLPAVDVYVKHPVRCEREVPATCVCCDSRAILVGYADGYWGSCSWFGKVSWGVACSASAAGLARLSCGASSSYRGVVVNVMLAVVMRGGGSACRGGLRRLQLQRCIQLLQANPDTQPRAW